MSETNPERSENLDVLKEIEITLKEREVALKEREIKAKIEIEKRGLFFSSPLLIGTFSAIFGVLGTGLGAMLQGNSNLKLERQQFESSLIQKALEIEDTDESAKSLLFLVDSGILQSLDGHKIRRLAENPDELPALPRLSISAKGTALAVSPDGLSLLIGDTDGRVHAFNLDGGQTTTFNGRHTDAVSSVVYAPDNVRIYTGSWDHTVKIWNKLGGQLDELRLQNEVIGLDISAGGNILNVRTANDEISQWDLKTLKKLRLIKLDRGWNSHH